MASICLVGKARRYNLDHSEGCSPSAVMVHKFGFCVIQELRGEIQILREPADAVGQASMCVIHFKEAAPMVAPTPPQTCLGPSHGSKGMVLCA